MRVEHGVREELARARGERRGRGDRLARERVQLGLVDGHAERAEQVDDVRDRHGLAERDADRRRVDHAHVHRARVARRLDRGRVRDGDLERVEERTVAAAVHLDARVGERALRRGGERVDARRDRVEAVRPVVDGVAREGDEDAVERRR